MQCVDDIVNKQGLFRFSSGDRADLIEILVLIYFPRDITVG